MTTELTNAERRFLQAICEAWPSQPDRSISMEANAAWLGKQLGLSELEVKNVAGSLAEKGLLHVRVVEGTILAHPSREGHEKSASIRAPTTFVEVVLKWLENLVRKRR